MLVYGKLCIFLVEDFSVMVAGKHSNSQPDVDNDDGGQITLLDHLYKDFELCQEKVNVGQMGRAQKGTRLWGKSEEKDSKSKGMKMRISMVTAVGS